MSTNEKKENFQPQIFPDFGREVSSLLRLVMFEKRCKPVKKDKSAMIAQN